MIKSSLSKNQGTHENYEIYYCSSRILVPKILDPKISRLFKFNILKFIGIALIIPVNNFGIENIPKLTNKSNFTW